MSARWFICSGSSQTRMLYSPTPKTVTSPTPGRRASLSRSCSVAKLRKEERVELVALRRERDDLERRGLLLLGHDALLLDRARELGHRRRHAVLDEHLGEVEVGADLEGHRERVAAVPGAVGLHVEHLLDAVDLLLDRQRHRLDQRLRARARIGRRDLDGGRRDRRILRDRQHEAAPPPRAGSSRTR